MDGLTTRHDHVRGMSTALCAGGLGHHRFTRKPTAVLQGHGWHLISESLASPCPLYLKV